MFLKTFYEKKKVIHCFIHTFIFFISGIKTFLKQFSNKCLNASINKTHTYRDINQQFASFIINVLSSIISYDMPKVKRIELKLALRRHKQHIVLFFQFDAC